MAVRSSHTDSSAGIGPRSLRPSPQLSRHGRTAEIALAGEVDLGDREALDAAVAAALAEGPTETLVVDLSYVTFLDSAVVHWLIESHFKATARDTRLVTLAPRGPVADLLAVFDVGHILSVVPAR